MKTFKLGSATYSLITDEELEMLIEKKLLKFPKDEKTVEKESSEKKDSERPFFGHCPCTETVSYFSTYTPVQSASNYRFNYVPVEVHLPFTDNHCDNWYENFNINDHAGIIYKGCKITLSELLTIKRMVKQTIPKDHNMLQVSLGFDGIQVTPHMIDEINFIEKAIKDLNITYKDRDRRIILK